MLKKRPDTIHFFFLTKGITLNNRKELKLFINRLIRKEGHRSKTINYIFCSDKYLLDFNRKYLNHNYYTDVITFRLSEERQPLEGEIYISVDRVRDNATSLAEKVNIELHRVIFHGTLHLCGYRDKTKKERMMMKEKENMYLNEYFPVSRDTVSP